MWLLLSHPETAARTCDECKLWIFDIETGRLVRDRGTDEPIARPTNCRMPCLSCPKCSGEPRIRTPDTGRQADFTRCNRLTWRLYWEEQASHGPTDDIMRKNFGIIHETLATYDRGLRQAAMARGPL